MANEIRSNKPVDRMTRLCGAMTDALEAHPEYGEDIKCCVFLDNGEKAGLTLNNYTDDNEAIVDLFNHLRAILKSRGMRMDIITVPNDLSGL